MSLIEGLKNYIINNYGLDTWNRVLQERREELMLYILDGDITPFVREFNDSFPIDFTPTDVTNLTEISQESGTVVIDNPCSITFQNRIQLSKRIWVKCSDLNGSLATIINQSCGEGSDPYLAYTNLGEIWLPRGSKLHSMTVSGIASDSKLNDIEFRVKLIGSSDNYCNLQQANVVDVYSGIMIADLKTNTFTSNTINFNEFVLDDDRQVCFYYRATEDVSSNKYFIGTRTLFYTIGGQ